MTHNEYPYDATAQLGDTQGLTSGDPIPFQLDNRKAYASGLTATVLAFLTGLSTALDGGVTGQEWVTIAIATITAGAAAFGITWSVPAHVK